MIDKGLRNLPLDCSSIRLLYNALKENKLNITVIEITIKEGEVRFNLGRGKLERSFPAYHD